MTLEDFEACYLDALQQVLHHLQAVSLLATQVADQAPQASDSTQTVSMDLETTWDSLQGYCEKDPTCKR